MVTVGFVVEGDSDKYLVESELFRKSSARYFVERLCALGNPR